MTLNAVGIKDTIRKFIGDRFMAGTGLKTFSDADSFLENGIIDSTGVLELVTFTEETFGLHVDDEDMIPDNLDSLDKLSEFILGKKGGGA